MKMGNAIKAAVPLFLVLLVTGCMATDGAKMPSGGIFGSKSADEQGTVSTGERSGVISQLSDRRSLLPAGGTYDKIAKAVLSSNLAPAEAELRAAKLRAEAQSKNWLPTIGPSLSLTSLRDFVASLVIEQVLFDNGRKKAEREFSVADVEVAAVLLSQDTNERVYDALDLYLSAEEGRDIATQANIALKDMEKFRWIMEQRVAGGVSDLSDLSILNHKISEIKSDRRLGEEKAATAMAELEAMGAENSKALSGLSAVSVDPEITRDLSVLKAHAEKDRDIARAKIERASNLPGLKATATGIGGSSDIDAALQTTGIFDLGMGARLKAVDATKEAASRKVDLAHESADRRLSTLEKTYVAAKRATGEAENLTRQAKQNLDVFQSQYEAGQRQIMDVVGVYETYARQKRSQIGHKYDAARAQLKMARDMGLLADGAEI